jgi:hypothetical protein
VQVELTPLASVVSFLIGFVIALNLVSLIAGPLLAVLLVVLGPAAVIAVGLGSLAALVALAVSAGLGWLFIQLAQAVANWVANSTAREALSSPAMLATIADGLDEAGVANYAGEGLAEALAIKAIEQAVEEGHGVALATHAQPDPDNPGRTLPPSGRERFRPQFFETVVVGQGTCRILLRVP